MFAKILDEQLNTTTPHAIRFFKPLVQFSPVLVLALVLVVFALAVIVVIVVVFLPSSLSLSSKPCISLLLSVRIRPIGHVAKGS